MDSLAASDRLLLECTKMVREDFLHQNAFEDIDTYTPLKKQFRMLDTILLLYHESQQYLEKGGELEDILDLPVKEKISRAKMIPDDKLGEFDTIAEEIKKEIAGASEREQE